MMMVTTIVMSSTMLAVPLSMMVIMVGVVVSMVSTIMVLVERESVEKRFLQAGFFSVSFGNLRNLLKLFKLVPFNRFSLHALIPLVKHVLKRVEVEEDGGVVLRVCLPPLPPHLLHLVLDVLSMSD